jgi:hypothetical protein
VSVAHILDDACTAILGGLNSGLPYPSELRVSESAYEAIALARNGDLVGGNPLMLLDLLVVSDPAHEKDNQVKVIWASAPEQE